MRILSVLLLALGIAGAAQADGFCDQLDSMMVQEEVREFTLPPPFEIETQCRVTKALAGGTGHFCGWPFAFRASEAGEAFEMLLASVAECLGKGADVSTDLGVNHPDTYDLRTFDAEIGTVSVSLKDKGALQQTYVFLRVERIRTKPTQ